MARLTHIALHVKDVEACKAFYMNYAKLVVAHKRDTTDQCIYWLAEKGKEEEFIFVLLPKGPGHLQSEQDFSHLGFALQSKAAVDKIAQQGKQDGLLLWEPRQEPYPVGYYCGILDPDGNRVECSYGQPLG